MTSSSLAPESEFPDERTFMRRLLSMSLALFLTYLTVAVPLPILTVYVTHQLGLSAGLGGLSVGIAFLSTILTRGLAGQCADKYGGKRTLGAGLLLYVIGSLVCLAAAFCQPLPALAYAVLLVGRLLVGFGESASMVGFVSWALAMAGPARSGRVMGWIGMGIYGAFVVGAPVGVLVAGQLGFKGVMLVSLLMPIIGYLMTRPITPDAPAHKGGRPSLLAVLPKIWKPGAAVCLQGVGFAAISAFITADFLVHQWQHVGLGLSVFGVGFVLSRLLFTRLPDRIGGYHVAYASLLVEAIGQGLLWLSHDASAALAGSFLTGLGSSMVFPAMGLEVVKRVPARLRGTAMGGYAAFQDLSYGITGPLIGLFVGSLGYPFAFLIGCLASLAGILMVWLGSREQIAQG